MLAVFSKLQSFVYVSTFCLHSELSGQNSSGQKSNGQKSSGPILAVKILAVKCLAVKSP